ncbi:MAG: hypothetical protein ACFCVE_11305 [Phycisphaerae bacterium]
MDAPKTYDIPRIIELARQRRLVRRSMRLFLLLQAAHLFDEMRGESSQPRPAGSETRVRRQLLD